MHCSINVAEKTQGEIPIDDNIFEKLRLIEKLRIANDCHFGKYRNIFRHILSRLIGIKCAKPILKCGFITKNTSNSALFA